MFRILNLAIVFPTAAILLLCGVRSASAQLPDQHVGETVPRDVREMYDRGLQYLSTSQTPEGNWNDSQQGAAVTASP